MPGHEDVRRVHVSLGLPYKVSIQIELCHNDNVMSLYVTLYFEAGQGRVRPVFEPLESEPGPLPALRARARAAGVVLCAGTVTVGALLQILKARGPSNNPTRRQRDNRGVSSRGNSL